MKNNLSRYEQEVHVSFNMDDKYATCYTSSPSYIKKLDALVKEFPNEYKVIEVGTLEGEVISKTYRFPRKFTKFFKPRKMSEEALEKSRERMASLRAKKGTKE